MDDDNPRDDEQSHDVPASDEDSFELKEDEDEEGAPGGASTPTFSSTR